MSNSNILEPRFKIGQIQTPAQKPEQMEPEPEKIPTTIEDYVCNLIAGRTPISNLYFAVDRARDQRSQGKQFCYKVVFSGYGNRMYKGYELVQLDDRAYRCSMDFLLSNFKSSPSLDNYVLLLLKAKNEILSLYQARYKALFMRSTSRIFCYVFTNPFGEAADVNTNKLTFKNASVFLDFFCTCENSGFYPTLVVPC